MEESNNNLPAETENAPQPQIQTTAIYHKQVVGPLPTADEFAGYEKVLQGAANRILAMAEKQSEHRHELEKRELEIDARDSLLGLIFAFVFSTTTMLGAFFLIYSGNEVAGSILGSASLASVVTAFRQSRKQDSKKKDEE